MKLVNLRKKARKNNMAYIELVIKIEEEVKQTFDNAKDEDLYGNYYDRNSLIGKAIQNGTPLPKGHGRLIDADELKTAFPCGEFVRTDCVRATIDYADAIIEAESED